MGRSSAGAALFAYILVAGCAGRPVCGHEQLMYDEDLRRCVCRSGLMPAEEDAGMLCIPADAGVGCTPGDTRPCPGNVDIGECEPGVQDCSEEGQWGECRDIVGPHPETCDGVDNDCNGLTDDGSADSACGSASRGQAGCTAGTCVVASCGAGFADCNGVFADGCEVSLGARDHCARCGESCGWVCQPTGCNDPVEISIGVSFACARSAAGHVWCWGSNADGRLGDGSTLDRPRPVLVHGLPTPAIQLSNGSGHACALLDTGSVYCWGRNDRGQLGNGTTGDGSVVPVRVLNLAGTVTRIESGGRHTCALTEDGRLQCWGWNASGQLGDGETRDRPVGGSVQGLEERVVDFSAGDSHTCAVLESGAVMCWGFNASGQVGDGTTTNRPLPVAVSGIRDATAVSAAYISTCVVHGFGNIACWGDNSGGELGNGTTISSSRPVPAAMPEPARALAAGRFHVCALADSGLYCWGNAAGVGDPTGTPHLEPYLVGGLHMPVASAAGGDGLTCSISAAGEPQCWGVNGHGEAGDGTTMAQYAPVDVLPPAAEP